MAKKSLKVKQQRKPKYSTRAYTRCSICGRPHSVLKKYGICRICFRELAYKGEIPGVKKALGFLIRKAIPTAVILLVYLLIVSPLLQGQSWYWLPDMASYTLWFPTTPADAPDAPIAWLTIIAWTLAFLVPSIIIGRRRDT